MCRGKALKSSRFFVASAHWGCIVYPKDWSIFWRENYLNKWKIEKQPKWGKELKSRRLSKDAAIRRCSTKSHWHFQFYCISLKFLHSQSHWAREETRIIIFHFSVCVHSAVCRNEKIISIIHVSIFSLKEFFFCFCCYSTILCICERKKEFPLATMMNQLWFCRLRDSKTESKGELVAHLLHFVAPRFNYHFPLLHILMRNYPEVIWLHFVCALRPTSTKDKGTDREKKNFSKINKMKSIL